MNKRRSIAFTLVELLIVIAIIAILIALLLPAMSKARMAEKDVRCKSQLRQIVAGLLMYAHDSRGYYPYSPMGRPDPAVIAWNGSNGNHTAGGPGDFDFRPLFRRYLGSNVLNNVLRCPLAGQWWFSNLLGDIDKTSYHAGMIKSPYAFYFGPECFTVAGAKQDAKWDRSQRMMKITDAWSPVSANSSQMRFTVVVSDFMYWNGFGGSWILSTHSVVHRSASEGGNWTDHNMGGIYPPGASTTGTANFARSDGSVVSHHFNYVSIARNALRGLRRQTAAQTYLVPAELAN